MGNVHPKQTGQVVSGWTGIAVEQAGSIQQKGVAYLNPQTTVFLKILYDTILYYIYIYTLYIHIRLPFCLPFILQFI